MMVIKSFLRTSDGFERRWEDDSSSLIVFIFADTPLLSFWNYGHVSNWVFLSTISIFFLLWFVEPVLSFESYFSNEVDRDRCLLSRLITPICHILNGYLYRFTVFLHHMSYIPRFIQEYSFFTHNSPSLGFVFDKRVIWNDERSWFQHHFFHFPSLKFCSVSYRGVDERDYNAKTCQLSYYRDDSWTI